MDDLRRELDRLRRAWAAARARAVLGRIYLAGLAGLALLALASRLLGPWPPFAALEGRVLLVLGSAAALWLLLPLLDRLAPFLGRPAPEAFARRLDDQHAWSDAADAALGLAPSPAGLRPVEAFLTAQTTGRLRELDERAFVPPRRLREKHRRLGRGVLLFLFVFALLAPGVDGWLGRGGAGRGDTRALAGADPADGGLDANRWLEEHARLYLTVPDREKAPLALRARLRTDRPLPVAYRTRLQLVWDATTTVDLEAVDVPEGEEAQREFDIDLPSLEALADELTPGRHVAVARIVPEDGPFTAPLESNEVVLQIEEGGGGGGGGGDAPQPQPEPTPEPSPEAPPEEVPTPEGLQEEPPEPPRGPEEIEVVDPFVRNDDRVEKEDAIVAVPDPEAGLEPPPPVPLAEALRDFDRILERAMQGERIRASDRSFLQRYFEALRRGVASGDGG